jgi:hypothetical protein
LDEIDFASLRNACKQLKSYSFYENGGSCRNSAVFHVLPLPDSDLSLILSQERYWFDSRGAYASFKGIVPTSNLEVAEQMWRGTYRE